MTFSERWISQYCKMKYLYQYLLFKVLFTKWRKGHFHLSLMLHYSSCLITNYSSNTKKKKKKIAVESIGLSGGHPTPSTLLSITWRVLGLSVKMLFTDFSSAFNTIILDILLDKLTNLVHVHWSKTFILTNHMSLQSLSNYKRLPPIHHRFNILPSGKKFRSIGCKTDRLKNSCYLGCQNSLYKLRVWVDFSYTVILSLLLTILLPFPVQHFGRCGNTIPILTGHSPPPLIYLLYFIMMPLCFFFFYILFLYYFFILFFILFFIYYFLYFYTFVVLLPNFTSSNCTMTKLFWVIQKEQNTEVSSISILFWLQYFEIWLYD